MKSFKKFSAPIRLIILCWITIVVVSIVTPLSAMRIVSDIAYPFVDIIWDDEIEESTSSLTVTNINDNGSGSLRDAASNALSGDIITFSDDINGDTIKLTSGQIILDKNLTILGNGLDSTIINGMASSRIFSITQNDTVSIDGITFYNGQTTSNENGGAINNGGDLTVRNCNFQGNEGRLGGAIYSDDYDPLRVINCTFLENQAEADGGAISTYGYLHVTHSTFIGNEALVGGAINNEDFSSDPVPSVITNCVFSGNIGTNDGGAIFSLNDLIITNSTIYRNRSNGAAGISKADKSLWLYNSAFMFNYNLTGPVVYNDITDYDGPDIIHSNCHVFSANGNHGITTGNGRDPMITVKTIPLQSGSAFVPTGHEAYGPLHNTGSNARVAKDTFDIDQDMNVLELIPTDILDSTRIVDIVDIGAFEYQTNVINTWYQDADGDTYGNAAIKKDTTVMPAGYVADSTDCDDNMASIYPSATEILFDEIDQNCDGSDLIYGLCVTDVDGNRTTGAFVSPAHLMSQSVKACETGIVTSIEVEVLAFTSFQTPGDARLEMRYGTDYLGDVAYSQVVSFTTSGKMLIHLNTPFPITKDSSFLFSFRGIGGTNIYLANTSGFPTNAYPDGNEMYDDYVFTSQDVVFKLNLGCDGSLVVRNTNDSGCGSLRHVMGLASHGDTITFDPSINGDTIKLTSGVISVGRHMTILGNDTTHTIISGTGNSQIFRSEGKNINLIGLNLQNGTGIYGGAINFDDGTVRIEKCLFANNSSISGGGAIFTTSKLYIDSTAIRNNHAIEEGGGIHSHFSSDSLFITNSVISHNVGDDGGGAYVGRELYFYNNIISNNHSGGEGGGIYADYDAIFIKNVITNNTSADHGGGLYIESEATLKNNTITGNSSDQNGGGVYIYDDDVTMINDRISGNQAMYNGGGVFINYDTYVHNVTISGNVAADGEGGGAYTNWNANFYNSIVALNTSDSGGSDIHYNRRTITSSHSMIGSTSGNHGIMDGVMGNIVGVDPLFVQNVPAAPSILGDLRLLPCSPAVNAGDNSSLPADLFDLDEDIDVSEVIPFDHQDSTRVVGTAVDMGAYESKFQPISGTVTRLYVNVNASGDNSGDTWGNAITDLQDALFAAQCANVTEIWVAKGTYKPTKGTDRTISFTMQNNLAIYGGFVGNEANLSQRDWSKNVTVLSGEIGDSEDLSDNSYAIVINDNIGLNGTAVLDGFTIRDAYFNDDEDENVYGGGVYVRNGSPIIRNCYLSHNIVLETEVKAQVTLISSNATVTNCVIAHHSSIIDDIFDSFDGLIISGGSPSFVNCTITNSIFGRAQVEMTSSATPSFINCILPVIDQSFSSNPQFKNCIIANGHGNCIDCPGGDGDVDPFFRGLADYRLGDCSQAIDAGDNTASSGSKDLDIMDRIHNGTIDIGAYEHRRAPVHKDVSKLYVNVNANGENNGVSWQDAFTDLQDALSAAQCPNINEIWVAAGTYKPNKGADVFTFFTMQNNLAIYGGFNGTETERSERNWGENVTILSADIGNSGDHSDNSWILLANFRNIFNIAFDPLDNSAILDGFILESGSDFQDLPLSYGIAIVESSPTIRNCTFKSLTNLNGKSVSVIQGDSPTFTNCAFYNELLLEDSESKFINCSISDTLYTDNSSLSFTNCIVPVIADDRLISSFNSHDEKEYQYYKSKSNKKARTYSNSILAEGDASCINCPGGDGEVDPLFVSSTDMSLQSGSPAIDAGLNSANALTRDVIGNDRISGNTIDIGAFEYMDMNLPLSILGNSVVCPGQADDKYTIEGGRIGASYSWVTEGTGLIIRSGQNSEELMIGYNNASINARLIVTALKDGITEKDTIEVIAAPPVICQLSNCADSSHLTTGVLISAAVPDIISTSRVITSDAVIFNKDFEFRAGESIEFMPGFTVVEGREMIAEIMPCVSVSSINDDNVKFLLKEISKYAKSRKGLQKNGGCISDIDNDNICDDVDNCIDIDGDGYGIGGGCTGPDCFDDNPLIPSQDRDCDGVDVSKDCDDADQFTGACPEPEKEPKPEEKCKGITCPELDGCIEGYTLDADCNCIASYAGDNDHDGVCDVEDKCKGYDDNRDWDKDGIPDGCDDDTACTDCTADENGEVTICWLSAKRDKMNAVKGDCDYLEQFFDTDGRLKSANTYCGPCKCDYLNDVDTDGDGVCDKTDECPNNPDMTKMVNCSCEEGKDACPELDCEIGSPCDDGNICTIDDRYRKDCNCVGIYQDTDYDGVCDGEDQCQGLRDDLDLDNNGVPDGCDPSPACASCIPNDHGQITVCRISSNGKKMTGFKGVCDEMSAFFKDDGSFKSDRTQCGPCQCEYIGDTDSDGDGTCDSQDRCPEDPECK